MKSKSVGSRFFLLILFLFVIVVITLFFFTQSHNTKNRISNTDIQLQNYNDRMHEVLDIQHFLSPKINTAEVDKYVSRHRLQHLRVTLIAKNGNVIYDNWHKDVSKTPNHKSRKEVKEALAHGKGYDISRASAIVKGQKFFYSATYYPEDGIIIRTALPFSDDLSYTLLIDNVLLAISVCSLFLIILLIYRFVNHLGRNIKQLKMFAHRVDNNEPLELTDILQFPNDELGEISEYIIKLYIRLQKTKDEQNILKRQLTQNAAHELKTPIAGIEGYLETILNSPDMDKATMRHFLERSYAQSKRLANLVGDISTLNRLDDGLSALSFTEVDVKNIIERVKEESDLELRKHGMEFDCCLPERMIIRGNPSLCHSIFRNLTDNAIAYAGEGTSISLICKEEKDGKCFSFTFSDNGTGVPPEHLPRLFERFYRVDTGRSRRIGGTGLGLAIVKNAVMAHGGSIEVGNNPHGGLCFKFTLPKGILPE